MEHRWSVRKHLSGQAWLSCPNGLAAQAVIHDLSLGGIGIITHCALVPGAYVQVSFALDEDLDPTTRALPALVVHSHNGHAGLVFLDAEPQTLQALRIVLQQHDGAPAAAARHYRVA